MVHGKRARERRVIEKARAPKRNINPARGDDLMPVTRGRKAESVLL
jgi:hypothetical protein